MASIRERHGRSGKISYTVTWRDADGRQCGEAVGSKREALKIKQSAEKHGKTDGHEGVVRGIACCWPGWQQELRKRADMHHETCVSR